MNKCPAVMENSYLANTFTNKINLTVTPDVEMKREIELCAGISLVYRVHQFDIEFTLFKV